MKQLKPYERKNTEGVAGEYFAMKGIEPSESVIGFIRENGLGDLSVADIDKIIETAKKLHGGVLIGSGDHFKVWCGKLGRELPSDEIVSLMNEDEYAGGMLVVEQIPKHSMVWRSLCSYRAGRGR